MQIIATNTFADPGHAQLFLEEMVEQVQKLNDVKYQRIDLQTSLGNTVVWGINVDRTELPALVVFPGFRTNGMFWDLDNGLTSLRIHCRIFLVDINGQPCLSDGNVPSIKNNDYGVWAASVIEKLNLKTATVAGASFGGLVCLKLCLIAPHLVEKAILLNPGCLQSFSLSFRNLYYNMLPLVIKTRKNVEKFLDHAVFYKEEHRVSTEARKVVLDYEYFAITQFTDKAEKPYAMSNEDLEAIKSDVYLILGDKDILFPYKKSMQRASQHIPTLKKTYVIPNTGHGIETSKVAIETVAAIMAGT